jgi:hypothetical protein
VDFALATAFAEIRPEFTHPTEIRGPLPCVAPDRADRLAGGSTCGFAALLLLPWVDVSA